MPTQRPFFANFFSVFRARTSPTFQAKSSPTTGAVTSLTTSAHISNVHTHILSPTTTTSSLPRSLTTRPSTDPSTGISSTTNTTTATTTTTTTTTSTQPIKITSPTPFSATAIPSHSPGTTFYSHHLPIHVARSSRPPSPGPSTTHGLALSPPGHATPAMTRGRPRRGSDSSNSSGGFMDPMTTDKWYIGGRTAAGEERFYKLGLVTGAAGSERMRSLDRLSL